MLKDLTNEICDNGYCEIKSDYFTSKVEHEYDFDDYFPDEEECDEDFDESSDIKYKGLYEPFGILDNCNKKLNIFGSYSYIDRDIRKNRFNVVINGIQGLDSFYLSNCVSEISFDNNCVYVKFLAYPKLYHCLYEEVNSYYDVSFGRMSSKPNFGDITIQVIDPTGVVVLSHKFFNTFISAINQDSFSYSDEDVQYLDLDVTFNYDHYLVEE